MPDYLPAEGKSEWRRVTNYLADRGLLHSGDLSLVEAHVSAVCRLRRIEAALAKVQLLQSGEDGMLLARAAEKLLIQANQAQGAVTRSMMALCLNPAARVKLAADIRKDPGSAEEAQAWSKTLRRVK